MRGFVIPAAVIAVLSFVGCSATGYAAPTVVGTPVIEDDCLPVDPAAQAALQRGLDDLKPGTKIVDIASAVSSWGDHWFVVASFASDGFGAGKGVWFTGQDPTTAADVDYVSLDAVAQTVSSFEPPMNIGMSMPGAQESLTCVMGTNHVATGSSRVMVPAPAGAGDTPLVPLEPGQSRRLAPDSMWSAGAEFRTSHVYGLVTLYLRLGLDWAVAAANGTDPANVGVDPWKSLSFTYVTKEGKTYDVTNKDAHNFTDEIEYVSVVHPPRDTVSATVVISFPPTWPESGTWRVTDAQGNAVYIDG